MFFIGRLFLFLALYLQAQMVASVDDFCLERTIMYEACKNPVLFSIEECKSNLTFTTFCESEDGNRNLSHLSPRFVDCPGYIGTFNLDSTFRSKTVTWSNVKAVDGNGTIMRIDQIAGAPNGSDFDVGKYVIRYNASNSHGDAICLVIFEVIDSDVGLCDPLNTPENGYFVCTDGNKKGSICFLHCSNGYISTATTTTKCQMNRQWSNGDVLWQEKCQDVCLPTIKNCPKRIMEFAIYPSNLEYISWSALTAEDNSKDSVFLRQIQGRHPGTFFPMGVSSIIYEATDTSGNFATCKFEVIIPGYTCQSLMRSSTCNSSITSCIDIHQYRNCAVNCSVGYLRKSDVICPTNDRTVWDLGNQFTCSVYKVKFLSDNSTIRFPLVKQLHQTLTIILNFRITLRYHGYVFWMEDALDKVFSISIIRISVSENFFRVTYKGQAINIPASSGTDWNNMRFQISRNIDRGIWTLEILQTIANTPSRYVMQGNSSSEENFPTYGGNFTAYFPPDQKGLEICEFMILDDSKTFLSSLSQLDKSFSEDLKVNNFSPSLREETTYNNTCRSAIRCDGKKCSCLHGFSGENCDIAPSVCKPGICKNGGECIQRRNNTFACNCEENFVGEFCETPVGCPKLRHQNDTVISCYGDLDLEICQVSCKKGRVRSDKYMHETFYECGIKTGKQWVLSRNQQLVQEREMPICADLVNPQSLTINLEVEFKNIDCKNIQPYVCIDYCEVNVTMNGCKKIGDSVLLTYLMTMKLRYSGNPLQLDAYYRKGVVNNPLLYLAHIYYVMESKRRNLELVEISNENRRKRRSEEYHHQDFEKKMSSSDSYQISKRSIPLNKLHGRISKIYTETECTAGSFYHRSSCVQCSPGTYQTDYGCVMCSPGFYQNKSGQTLCLPCLPGHLSAVGSTSYLECFVIKTTDNGEDWSTLDILQVVGVVFGGLTLCPFVFCIKRCRTRLRQLKKEKKIKYEKHMDAINEIKQSLEDLHKYKERVEFAKQVRNTTNDFDIKMDKLVTHKMNEKKTKSEQEIKNREENIKKIQHQSQYQTEMVEVQPQFTNNDKEIRTNTPIEIENTRHAEV